LYPKQSLCAAHEHELAAKITTYGWQGAKRRMHMKYLKVIFALAIITPGLASGAIAYSGEKLAKTAQITMEQAIEVALKARPGKITDKELEREKGGSGLRYSFDVLSKGITYEVGVDAQTGTVLEDGREGAHPD
jgi:Peptidase propeptide and YPEB domain